MNAKGARSETKQFVPGTREEQVPGYHNSATMIARLIGPCVCPHYRSHSWNKTCFLNYTYMTSRPDLIKAEEFGKKQFYIGYRQQPKIINFNLQGLTVSIYSYSLLFEGGTHLFVSIFTYIKGLDNLCSRTWFLEFFH